MAASTPQVFSGVTPTQFAKLTEKAKAAGMAINGNSGSASRLGVEVEWNYSEEKQELILTCLHTPFFLKRARCQRTTPRAGERNYYCLNLTESAIESRAHLSHTATHKNSLHPALLLQLQQWLFPWPTR